MARIAVLEESETLRDEEDVGPDPDPDLTADDGVADRMDVDESGDASDPSSQSRKVEDGRGKYIATTLEIQEAFDAVNTLRYSQPTHLAGTFCNQPSPSQSVHHGSFKRTYTPRVSIYYNDNAICFTSTLHRPRTNIFLYPV